MNRQPLRRARDLLGSLRVSVFTPDDLAIVKGGPASAGASPTRCWWGCILATTRCGSRSTASCASATPCCEGAGGRLDEGAAFTLDVWDAKLAGSGGALAAARLDLLDRMRPPLAATYDALARRPAHVEASYEAAWAGAAVRGGEGSGDRQAALTEALAAALASARSEDVRRGVSTTGPHRDEVALSIGGAPARNQASQGEQRTLALALRLAAHDVVTEVGGSPPVLLLDDVFSELDPGRSAALLAHLPATQTLLTTAGALPPGAEPERVLRLEGGRIVA